MSQDQNEPNEDDLYLARFTTDEVGADVDTHGHIPVTSETATQDPFTAKGSLANALDEAEDFSNPNNIPDEGGEAPTGELTGEVEGASIPDNVEEPPRSDEAYKPNDATIDEAPVPQKGLGDTRTSLVAALDSITMDSDEDVPSNEEEDASRRYEEAQIKEGVAKLPKSLGGDDSEADENGLVYLTYTFSVDPAKYVSNNYQPIANAGAIDANRPALVKSAAADLFASNGSNGVDELSETVELTEEEQKEEPTAAEEQKAASTADKEEAKEAEDEAPESVVFDYATYLDGTSFLCFDEDNAIDYSKIAMDAGVKKPVTRDTCKTTFAQCRAKNPLFCRFHGPKLLEKDIKTTIAATIGKGCLVSVTKDKGQKNPMTFRLTIGCPPSKKKDVQNVVHQFMVNNPGISSAEKYKDLDKGISTTEFDLDILKVDQPPKGEKEKRQVILTEQAKKKGKKMPVVGNTPPKVEKAVAAPDAEQMPVEPKKAAKKPKKETEPVEEPAPISTPEPVGEPPADDAEGGESASTEGQEGKPSPAAEEETMFADLVDEAKDKGLFDIDAFKKGYDSINLDHMTYPTLASKIDALEKLIDENDWDSISEKEMALQPKANNKPAEKTKGSQLSDSIVVPNPSAKKDGDGSESDAESHSVKPYDVKQMLQALYEVNSAIPDFLVSYDASDAVTTQDPTDIKIHATGNGDFGKMMDTLNNAFKDSGYKVEGTNVDDMHFVAASSGSAQEGGSGEGDEPRYVDEAAQKMHQEIKSIADEDPVMIAGDDGISALYYGATSALNEMDLYKQGVNELEGKLKAFDGKKKLTAAQTLAKKSLTEALKAQKGMYDDSKANAELSVKDFKESVKKFKSLAVEAAKAASAKAVEDIAKSTARLIFPHGKPDGVNTPADMVDELHEELQSFANEKMPAGGDLGKDFIDIKKTHEIGPKYKAVAIACTEFDKAIKDFKGLMDEADGKEKIPGLTDAVGEVSKKSLALKDAFVSYKDAIDKAKQEVEQVAAKKDKEIQTAAQKGSDAPLTDEEIGDFVEKGIGAHDKDYYTIIIKNILDSGGHYHPATIQKLKNAIAKFPPDHKVANRIKAALEQKGYIKAKSEAPKAEAPKAEPSIKEKIAKMSLAEKLPFAIQGLHSLIAKDPNNAELKKKLKVYEAALAKIYKENLVKKSKDDDFLE